MFVTKKAISRRTFVRGAGVALSLPLLDSMVPALTAISRTAANAVPRLGWFYVPNGMHMPLWKPHTPGKNFEMSEIMGVLEPFRDHLTAFGGLNNYNAGLGDGGGPHTRNQAAWLSGIRAKQGETDVRLGVTADQFAAESIGRDTLLPTLQVCTDANTQSGSCDNGYSCLYVNHLAWKSPTEPVPMEHNPRVVFERLFGDESDPKARAARMQADRSILDAVYDDLKRFGLNIGAGDRTRLDEYLAAVRDVEMRIQRAELLGASTDIELVDRPVGVPETFEDHALILFDLIFLAYQADLTRVAAFSIAREQGGQTYNNIGVPEGHHECSHHQNDPHKHRQLTKINKYHLVLLSHFLERMKSTADGDGSLLDHAAIVYGAGQSDGDLHSPLDLPTLLFGKGRGTIRGNQYLDYPSEDRIPLMNLHLSLLESAGVRIDEVGLGDGTGILTDL